MTIGIRRPGGSRGSRFSVGCERIDDLWADTADPSRKLQGFESSRPRCGLPANHNESLPHFNV